MIGVSADTIRIFLHVLAAAVWVGGQVTMTGLLRPLRELGGDAPRAAARGFGRVAWPAYALVVVTGVWNLAEVDVGDRDTAYQVTLFVKLFVVAASGIGAFLHTRAVTKVGLAVWGAVGGAAALGALFLGVQLRVG